MWFGIALGIAALLYEATASRDAVRAWWNGRAGSMLAAGAIWFCAFAFSVNNWIGAASENQVEKSNLHKAALMETKAVTGNLADAEAKLDRLRKSREELSLQPVREGQSNTKPFGTPQQAAAAVASAKVHKWFTGVTEGCTKTVGPQTRAFCDRYRSAEAEVARWGEISKLEIAIGDAEADVKRARFEVSNANLETSEERGDLVLLTKWGGLAEADAATLNGLFAIVVVSIFLSFGSMRAEIEELSASGVRTPFNWWRKARRAVSQAAFGHKQDEEDPERIAGEPHVIRTTITDRRALELLADVKRQLLAQPAAA
jgi:hypothetical protein